MTKKEVVGGLLNKLRLMRQRATFEGWQPAGLHASEATINDILAQLLLLLERLDEVIGTLRRFFQGISRRVCWYVTDGRCAGRDRSDARAGRPGVQ